jgi:hypothetical protein
MNRFLRVLAGASLFGVSGGIGGLIGGEVGTDISSQPKKYGWATEFLVVLLVGLVLILVNLQACRVVKRFPRLRLTGGLIFEFLRGLYGGFAFGVIWASAPGLSNITEPWIAGAVFGVVVGTVLGNGGYVGSPSWPHPEKPAQ